MIYRTAAVAASPLPAIKACQPSGNEWRCMAGQFNLPSGGCLDLLKICPLFSGSAQEVSKMNLI